MGFLNASGMELIKHVWLIFLVRYGIFLNDVTECFGFGAPVGSDLLKILAP